MYRFVLEIAFAYKGDIYVVDSRGGMARQLTTGDSYESSPVWSHDGKILAFISDREGGMDIFTVASAGGAAQRVTTHSTREFAGRPADLFLCHHPRPCGQRDVS